MLGNSFITEAAESADTTVAIKSFCEIIQKQWYQVDVESVDPSAAEDETPLTVNERVGHSIIANPETKKLFLIGGGNHTGDLNEVWTIDYSHSINPLKAILHESRASFPGRYEFLCASNGKGQAHIFGGADYQKPRNDLLVFDLQNEILTVKSEGGEGSNENIPAPRTQGSNSCLMFLNGEEYLVVFGGGQKGETPVPDGNIYTYKISEDQWTRVEVKNKTPDPMQGHAMVVIGTKVFVHGGMRGMHLCDDLYVIDLAEKEPLWIPICPNGNKPCARAAQGIIGLEKEFVIFGGLGNDGALSDFWKFNTESMEWSLIEFSDDKQIPAPRFDFAMTRLDISYPEISQAETSSVLLLHGGMNTEGVLFKDYWVYPLHL